MPLTQVITNTYRHKAIACVLVDLYSLIEALAVISSSASCGMHQHHTSEVAVHKRGAIPTHKHAITADGVILSIKTPAQKRQRAPQSAKEYTQEIIRLGCS